MKTSTKFFIGITTAYLAMYLPIMALTTYLRGYWAIGGEVFIPLLILLFGLMVASDVSEED